MRRSIRGPIAVAAALALAAGAAACTDDEGGSSGSAATPVAGKVSGPKDRLTVLAAGPTQAWDPQRITQRQAAGFASRTWMRTLTTYAPASNLGAQRKLVADLASTRGSANKDATQWTFSLRKGSTWQDGSPITCSDVQYGVARSFDEKIPSSGYALTYLDIPKKKNGTSTYPGPLVKGGTSAKAKKLLSGAVECTDDRTVVFHLAEPVGNFDEVVSLPEFAPYKKSHEAEDATYEAFSSGPYKLSGAWTPSSGGTWVRNPAWDGDSDPVRKVGPKSILHKEGIAPKDALETVLDGDDGGHTLALDPTPSALAPALEDAGDKAQSVQVDGQVVDYLAVSTKSKAMKSVKVRQALATATNRGGYVEARGNGLGAATWSLLGTALPSAHETVGDNGPGGDAAKARKQLTRAKVTTPVKIKVAYRADAGMDDAMKALEGTWEDAGFDVSLKGLGDDYFAEVGQRKVAEDYDIVWANWGPDFPSAGTVLPPLFDERVNLSPTSVGRDYGLFSNAKVSKAMDKAAAVQDPTERAKAWAKIDTGLLEDGVYIPLRQNRVTSVAGSEVTSLIGNPVFGGAPEIGVIGVSQ